MAQKNYASVISSGATSAATFVPEFARLPCRGGDPVCGLSRSWWYNAERQGLIHLHRIRRPGQPKGKTLLPVQPAIDLIKRLGTAEKVSLAVNAAGGAS